jgi:hypothetical protein
MSFEVTFVLLDAYGRTTRRTYGSTRTTIADAASDATSMVGLITAISGCAVSKYYISQVVVVSNPAADALANLDAGATLHCRMNNGKMVGMKIPAFPDGILNPDGTVDIADSDVAAFVAAFATGGYWRVSEGNYIEAIISGELDR